MPVRVGPVRRIGTALTWPAGVALTSWSYIWRTTVMRRRELDGSPHEDMPRPIPLDVERDEIQTPDDGSGPLFHRTYTGLFRDADMTPEELIAHVSADPNRVAPTALARFRKTTGSDGAMRVGDEFLVHMPGPWDGPVRVIETTPTSFRLATLEGHLEAGQIEWRSSERDGYLCFEIDSRARAGDRLSALLHDSLLMAKEVQLHMWTSVIERVAKASGGRLTGGIDIETRRVDPSHFGLRRPPQ